MFIKASMVFSLVLHDPVGDTSVVYKVMPPSRIEELIETLRNKMRDEGFIEDSASLHTCTSHH